MSHSGPLIELGRRLSLALDAGAVFRAPVWGDPRRMTEALREVERSFNSISTVPPAANIHRAVLSFAHHGGAQNFIELKHVCHGITMPMNDEGRCLIHSAKFFGMVLGAVELEQRDSRRYRRCYQALLQSYFAFVEVDGLASKTVAKGNFETLRAYLLSNLPVVTRLGGKLAAPAWVEVLKEHTNLLTDDPCSRYAVELVKGSTDRLSAVCDGLGISRQSWVWHEVVLAYLREVCEREDKAFTDVLPRALDLADGQMDLKLDESTARKVTAELVKRYERSTPRPEHPRLRDLAVALIGNPWLKKTAWDAWVKHEPARKMIDGWLKTRLIRDFFELLAQDGAAEKRRLDYWLRFESVIDDMWFVLGDDARANRSPEFKELRSRMTGRDRVLAGNTTADNNAFVMRIGKLLLIEFGVTGNACFVFDAEDFRTDLEQRQLSITQLKQAARATKLTHQSAWEFKFDNEICPRIGFRPSGRLTARSAPGTAVEVTAAVRSGHTVDWPFATKAATEVIKPLAHRPIAATGGSSAIAECLQFCTAMGIEYEDLRSKGGSLWVYADATHSPGVLRWLERLGFKLKRGRGYWLA
jgi:hypothetical protein